VVLNAIFTSNRAIHEELSPQQQLRENIPKYFYSDFALMMDKKLLVLGVGHVNYLPPTISPTHEMLQCGLTKNTTVVQKPATKIFQFLA
jgi:hypothetical protein